MYWWLTVVGLRNWRCILAYVWLPETLLRQWYCLQRWQVHICARNLWICWLWADTRRLPTAKEGPWFNLELSNPKNDHWYQIMVRSHQSSSICLLSVRSYGTIQGTAIQEETQKILLGWGAKQDFWEIQRNYCQPDQGWSVFFWTRSSNLLVYRLVENWSWLHALSEAL